MAIAKLDLNNSTQMDVTNVTVIASKLKSGITALGNNGELITGTNTAEYSDDDWFDIAQPSGDIVITSNISMPQALQFIFRNRTGITSFSVPNFAGSFGKNYLYNCPNLVSVSAPKCSSLQEGSIRNCNSIIYIVFPKVTWVGNYGITGTSLTGVDLGGTPTSTQGIGTYAFSGSTSLNTLVLRANTVWKLSSSPSNAFGNTPFASGKAGGTLYVPNDQISAYQSATNWSTLLGYTNNQIKSIESTHTDPDAPIDLTTHYVDGTLIPTT